MNLVSQTIKEQQAIHAIAQELTEKGYNVTLEPSVGELPFKLGSYCPDLIAVKNGSGIIFEAKANTTRLSVDRLQEVAERIAEHDGWQFRLVTANDIDGYEVDSDTDLPSWTVLSAKIEAIATLIQTDMLEPALLYLWSTVEAMLRKQAIAQHLPIDRFPPHPLLKHMYSSGELSMDEFDILTAVQQKRNRVAHGLITPIDLHELEESLTMVKSLISQWQN